MNKLEDLIIRALDAELVPFLEGPPGVGKSEASRKVADEFNLKFVDVRLSTLDPTDISGIPSKVEITREDGTKHYRMEHLISDLFPVEGDALPLKYKNGNTYFEDEYDEYGKVVINKKTGKPNQVLARYDGWLVSFEEITSCVPAMQAAAFRILLEREVGKFKLHPNVELMATGNRLKDKGAVIPMTTPLRTRLCIIEVDVDNAAWIKWAHANKVDQRIISYLQWRPENLFAFDPNIKQLNCAVPRTWRFADKLLKQDTSNVYHQLDPVTEQLLSGVIGPVKDEFTGFIAVFKNLISIDEILKDPANAPIPAGDSEQYALTSVLSNEMAKDKNIKDLVSYINRLNPELQTVTYMESFRKNRATMANSSVLNWITANQDMVNAEI